MKTGRIVSPYYDFTVFQSKNPYLMSRNQTPMRLRSSTTAEDKSTSSRSHNSSRKTKSSTSSGKQDISCAQLLSKEGIKVEPLVDEELSDYQHLKNQSKCCQTPTSIKHSPKPKRVASQSFFSLSQQIMNKSARDSQNTLRYLLKLSNNTFYATLKHEIDLLKKKELSLQNELSVHSQSILKGLKSQNNGNEAIEKILAHNQRLENDLKTKENLFKTLLNEVQELKLKNIEIEEKMMNNEKVKRSHQSLRDVSTKSSSPRSTPSMIPKQKKPDKSVQVVSEPSKINQQQEETHNSNMLLQNERKLSEITTNFSAGSSHYLSEHGISCSKNHSCDNVTQQAVGTSYSMNDFCAPSESFCSMKLKKRQWKPRWKLFCC